MMTCFYFGHIRYPFISAFRLSSCGRIGRARTVERGIGSQSLAITLPVMPCGARDYALV